MKDGDPNDVRELLSGLPAATPPEGVWERIRAELDAPSAPGAVPWGRWRVPPWLAVAATMAGLLAGTLAGGYRAYGAPGRWSVAPLSGAPRLAGRPLEEGGGMGAGEWLVTDSASRAAVEVGRIGRAEVGPNSRVRMEQSGLLQHRLSLEEGMLEAVIGAPPRLFFVSTPSARATDLGCAYTLEVDSTGVSRLRVTDGWVELEGEGAISVVPAGMVAVVEPGGRPGTPYPDLFPAPAREALARLDAGSEEAGDLDTVLSAVEGGAHAGRFHREGAVTLWHLLQRVEPALRPPLYRSLEGISPPPAGVTMEGILALDRPMLERWRRELTPMWAESAPSWWIGIARRLWEWGMR